MTEKIAKENQAKENLMELKIQLGIMASQFERGEELYPGITDELLKATDEVKTLLATHITRQRRKLDALNLYNERFGIEPEIGGEG